MQPISQKLEISVYRKNYLDSSSHCRKNTNFWDPTFYVDANKSGKADSCKVFQSAYDSVQKSELHTSLMISLNFREHLNMVTDSQYAESVVLHMETVELIPDGTELNFLFIQL